METKALDSLISQLHNTAALARGGAAKAPAAAAGSPFADLLKNSLDQVNATQDQARELTEAFAAGKPGTSLHDVMIAGAKANIAFQATVQVRNKLVSAYHDIMNMQV